MKADEVPATTSLTVERESARTDEATRLINALFAELYGRYGYEGSSPFEPEQVASDKGTFVVARLGGTAVGCGAIRLYEPGVGEVKRVYVAPEARGKGIGKSIMQALEHLGSEAGLHSLVLETGILQPEAMTLYESLGYQRIPSFGAYANDPMSVCYTKSLVDTEK